MSTQDRTLDHYQELMTINATSHLLRAARQLGLFEQLAEGQKTLAELATNLNVSQPRMAMLLDCLIAIGIIEQYQEDFAMSSTARLLCQYDADLGDATWEQIVDSFTRSSGGASQSEAMSSHDAASDRLRDRFDAIAATQWIHTPAAMQVAEILDLGSGEATGVSSESPASSEATQPIELLDLGCGSAVWSCAMAFRDPAIQVTGVDSEAALVAAQSTADSIGLTDRFQGVVGDVLTAQLAANAYDMIVIAQRLHAFPASEIKTLLDSLLRSLRPGGRLIVIDSFRGPHRPALAESLEAMRMQIQTHAGEIPELEVAENRMQEAGFASIQFTFIAASRIGLGMMIGDKP